MVKFIEDSLQRAEIAEAILAALPDWFGIPENTKGYVDACRESPLWACFSGEKAIGFIALKATSAHTAEVYVMGVLPEHHRKGVGKQLFQAFHDYAKLHNFSYMQVKTVAQGHYDEYDRTGFFYQGLGFKELECFPTLWDEFNPCQIYVMAV